ncbi:MAG: TonB-dependent receptor, partial [Bacteroidia bacterium]|nr:TonB-dependent receptor [Bacteroidia bacterium]
VAFSFSAAAQSGSVRGFVYDKDSGEPLIFTSVFLTGTTIGAATDVNGYYSITKIPPGTYLLSSNPIGYDSLSVSITVKDGDLLTRQLYLKKGTYEIDAVEISAEKQAAKTDVKMSVNKITPKEIKTIPAIGGEPDLAQYLQVLPGVIFTGDQGGQLYIRGGTPIQNKVLLDGMVVYNPFHSIGLFSVFDQDIIRNADVYTGGFGAEYGGRISSIMDITTKDGNKKHLAGKISASPFTSKLILEGPIKKAKTVNDGSSSFIASGKTSYLRQSSEIFYNYIDTGGLPYNFTDLYGKIVLSSPTGSKLNLFGFNYSDNVEYRQISDLNWNATGFGTSFVLIPGGSALLLDGGFSYSSYEITLAELDQKPRSSLINGFNMNLDFSYFIRNDEIKYGIEVLGFQTNFEFFNSANRKIEQVENTSEFGGFVKYKKVWDRVVLEPSFRVHYYGSLSEVSPEPRIGLKVNVTNGVRLKGAAGLYSQNLIAAVSDRDIVNLFYGFLSGEDDLPKRFNGEEVTSKLQKARHLIAGVEVDLPFHLSLNVEAYLKRFSQLTNVNRDKVFDDTASNSDEPDYLKKDYIIETGDATGIDFVLKYDYRRLYVWAVYSLGHVERFDGLRTYNPHFDRRHNVNFVASYTFGKDLNWTVNGRWNLGSGFPFTQTAGFYEYLDFADGLNTDYTDANGDLGILYGELNGGRLPYYHRLDVSVTRKFELSERSTLEANASIVNVYDRENIFYFDRIKYERVNQLPILPSVGLSLTF